MDHHHPNRSRRRSSHPPNHLLSHWRRRLLPLLSPLHHLPQPGNRDHTGIIPHKHPHAARDPLAQKQTLPKRRPHPPVNLPGQPHRTQRKTNHQMGSLLSPRRRRHHLRSRHNPAHNPDPPTPLTSRQNPKKRKKKTSFPRGGRRPSSVRSFSFILNYTNKKRNKKNLLHLHLHLLPITFPLPPNLHSFLPCRSIHNRKLFGSTPASRAQRVTLLYSCPSSS